MSKPIKPGFYWVQRGLGSEVAQLDHQGCWWRVGDELPTFTPDEVEGPAYHPDDVSDLLDALEQIAADCEADYPPSHGAIKHAARAAIARAKGKEK